MRSDGHFITSFVAALHAALLSGIGAWTGTGQLQVRSTPTAYGPRPRGTAAPAGLIEVMLCVCLTAISIISNTREGGEAQSRSSKNTENHRFPMLYTISAGPLPH